MDNDDDPENDEWKNNETIQGCSDKLRDDDVRIVINENGQLSVRYVEPDDDYD